MAGEPLRRFVEESYAQLRLDGKTHEQAMAEIREAISEAIPHAVAQYMDELSAGPKQAKDVK